MALCVLLGPAAAQPPPQPIQYDLQPGDRLVYRQILDREIRGPDSSTRILSQWDNQVVIVAAPAGRLAVGFQRNRVQVDLLRYEEDGRDRLAEERPAFAQRIAGQPSYSVEANLVDRRGWPGWYWSAVRESVSQLLPSIHEITPLPAGALEPGARWNAEMLGFALQATGWEELDPGGRCVRVEGTAGHAARLRYWFCPSDGAVRRLEVEGTYPLSLGRTSSERLTLELVERRRGEKVSGWLPRADLRGGVLAALTICDRELPVGPEALEPLLLDGDVLVQRQLLALAYRRGWAWPFERLAASPDERVRALAALEVGAPAVSAGWAEVARAAQEDRAVESWDCRVPSWSEQALLARRLPDEPPGTTVRPMQSEGFRGWPYVLHVPEEYRGDRPLPLLIFLLGGGGGAVPAAQNAIRAVAPLGWLAVFPNARGMWWDPESVRMFPALLDEILRGYNVDTNRVYLVGMSNGATGGLDYATRWPQQLAGASILMGAGIYHPSVRRESLVNLANLPLLFVHGKDDQVLPDDGTRNTVEALRDRPRKAPLEMQLLPKTGHEVSLGSDRDLTVPFFKQQVRNPFPRKLSFRTDTLEDTRHYWVELLAKAEGWAEVEAEIGDDNTIRLKTRRVERLRLLLRRELLPSGAELRVLVNGRQAFAGPLAEDCGLLHESWRATADPFLAYSTALELDVPR